MNPVEFSDTGALEQRVGNGDSTAFGELLMRCRDRLERIVRFRMDTRLTGRIDPVDVVQDAFVEATERLENFREQDVVFFVWLRFLTVQRLAMLHRRHLGTRARDVGREVSIYTGPMPEATSADLAARLLGRLTSPSQAAMRLEMKVRVEDALNEMTATDREVLALRYFEQLSNAETASVLNIDESAASNRYVRALKRLRQLMDVQQDA